MARQVVVIGGGIIGLASAWALRKGGADVMIVDRDNLAERCSMGNAGWVFLSVTTPVPSPGLVGTSMKWMLHRDSPLYIRPRLDPQFATWLLRFWRQCRTEPYRAGVEAMAHLNRTTVEGFDAWLADGIDYEMHETGLVFAFLSEALIEEALPEIEILEEFGMPAPEILDHNGMQKLDPAFSDNVVGGFHMSHSTERHVRPETLVRGLEKRLREMGVEFRNGVDVKQIERRGTSVRLTTSAGTIDAEQALIATGALASELTRQLGAPLPLTAGKGYSITIENPTLKVRHAIELVDARAAVTPFDGALRVAGTMELSGTNLKMDQARVDAVRRAGHKYLREWEQGTGESVWVGMRPMSSDGLPIIGSVPGAPNVYVATGHGMLGLTLAAATGNLIASQMLEGVVPPELLPFSPARFS